MSISQELPNNIPVYTTEVRRLPTDMEDLLASSNSIAGEMIKTITELHKPDDKQSEVVTVLIITAIICAIMFIVFLTFFIITFNKPSTEISCNDYIIVYSLLSADVIIGVLLCIICIYDGVICMPRKDAKAKKISDTTHKVLTDLNTILENNNAMDNMHNIIITRDRQDIAIERMTMAKDRRAIESERLMMANEIRAMANERRAIENSANIVSVENGATVPHANIVDDRIENEIQIRNDDTVSNSGNTSSSSSSSSSLQVAPSLSSSSALSSSSLQVIQPTGPSSSSSLQVDPAGQQTVLSTPTEQPASSVQEIQRKEQSSAIIPSVAVVNKPTTSNNVQILAIEPNRRQEQLPPLIEQARNTAKRRVRTKSNKNNNNGARWADPNAGFLGHMAPNTYLKQPQINK
jgi:hypothetical protein